MKFYIDEVCVVFPYDFLYPEQLEYMRSLKEGLDRRGHVLLEMPSGTGKTISLLSLLVAYWAHHPPSERIRIIYCTRTVAEMTKTADELRRLIQCWREADGVESSKVDTLRAVCLSARKNLCINRDVSRLSYGQEVDAACRQLTAEWSDGGCPFYTEDIEDWGKNGAPPLESAASEIDIPPGVHDVNALRRLGAARGRCPYYLARRAVETCDIVIHSFLYVVDPRASAAVMKHHGRGTIVVLDEGHNVDDVSIESLSMIVSRVDTANARDHNLRDLKAAADRVAATNRQRLQDEYDRLVHGRALAPAHGGGVGTVGAILPHEVLEAAVPAQVREASQFLQLLHRIVDFFHRLITRMTYAQVADPATFLSRLREDCASEVQSLQMVSSRLASLMNTLQIADSYKFRHLSLIGDFVTTLAAHVRERAAADAGVPPGFVVICEPHDPQTPLVPDPVLRLSCVDASLALQPLFKQFDTVVLTSGTLSPLSMYPRILGFTPVVARSLPMTMSRRCICPVVVTRSADQAALDADTDAPSSFGLCSSFKVRKDAAVNAHVLGAYASLLMALARTVPDGIVCFFTGYQYMNEVLGEWSRNGFLRELSKHKLVFVETQGVDETAKALAYYRRACDVGRGGIFMSIARGKIAEGIDFDRHYGRAVVVFGVPFLPPTDRALAERLRWMEAALHITDSEYRTFDAMRQSAQCIGRVLRNKTDYGMMILVDRRFARPEMRRKLPRWIDACVEAGHGSVSTEGCRSIALRFFREMAQPWEDDAAALGSTLLSRATLGERGFLAPQDPPRTIRVAALPAQAGEAEPDAGADAAIAVRPVRLEEPGAAPERRRRTREVVEEDVEEFPA